MWHTPTDMASPNEVVQQGSCWSWYATTRWYECLIMNWPCLIYVMHVKGYGSTSNHSPDMLRCYPASPIRLQNCPLTRWWSCPRGNIQGSRWSMDHVWQLSNKPRAMTSPPTTPQTYSDITLVFWPSFKLHHIQVMKLSDEDDTGTDILPYNVRSIGSCMDDIWRVWCMPRVIPSPPTTL